MGTNKLMNVNVTDIDGCVRAARSKRTPVEVLNDLAEKANAKILTAVVGNSNTPTEALANIVKKYLGQYQMTFTPAERNRLAAAISRNPNLSYADLRGIASKLSSTRGPIVRNIAKNPNVDIKILSILVENASYSAKKQDEMLGIYLHPLMTAENILNHCQEMSSKVAFYAGRDPRITKKHIMNFKGAMMPGSTTLWAGFSENPNTDGSLLEACASNPNSWEMRFGAVGNPNLTEGQKKQLREDSDERVKLYAHLRCPTTGMENMPTEWVEAYTSLSMKLLEVDESSYIPPWKNYTNVLMAHTQMWLKTRGNA